MLFGVVDVANSSGLDLALQIDLCDVEQGSECHRHLAVVHRVEQFACDLIRAGGNLVAAFGRGPDTSCRDDPDQLLGLEAVDVVVEPGDRRIEEGRDLGNGPWLLQSTQDAARGWGG